MNRNLPPLPKLRAASLELQGGPSLVKSLFAPRSVLMVHGNPTMQCKESNNYHQIVMTDADLDINRGTDLDTTYTYGPRLLLL